MLFILICKDKPDSVDVRKAHRPAHLQYLKDAGDRIKLAGPTLTPENTSDEGSMSPQPSPMPTGSLIILDADSEGAVKLFAEYDPYNQAGLFESVTIQPWTAAAGVWKPAE